MYEEDKAHQFMMGLNDDLYSTLRSQILALDPLPSLDRIFNMMQQEESHKKVIIARDNRTESGVAFAMKEQGQMYEKGACEICGRFGHEEAVCYETRGCGWGSRGGRNSRSSRVGNRAAGRGAFREVASVALHAKIVNGSNPRTRPGPVTEIAVTTNSTTQPNIPRLTADQVQRLLSLIDAPQLGYKKLLGKVSWMLDNGASCHMVEAKTMLSGVKQITLVTIGLRNGAHTMASEMGLTT